MNRLRREFAGLRPTPLAKDLGLLAAGAAAVPAVWALIVFFIWCFS